MTRKSAPNKKPRKPKLRRVAADVVGVRSTPWGWLLIALAALGLLILLGAAIVQFVAWIGAVINASQLPDKTWFIVLLVTGLLSFGLIGMIIYLIAAPDSERLAHVAARTARSLACVRDDTLLRARQRQRNGRFV